MVDGGGGGGYYGGGGGGKIVHMIDMEEVVVALGILEG